MIPLVPFILSCLVLLFAAQTGHSLRFFLEDKEECFHHDVEYSGDLVHVSFVVVKFEGTGRWQNVFVNMEVDLSVEGPGFRHDVLGKHEDKFEFTAPKKGSYSFCFRNSNGGSLVDFDIHVGHIPIDEEHAKDDHFTPLTTQVAKLHEAIYSVQFHQHWLEVQRERQLILNEKLSKRVIRKALVESCGLVGASILQVYLLRRLFNKKLNNECTIV